MMSYFKIIQNLDKYLVNICVHVYIVGDKFSSHIMGSVFLCTSLGGALPLDLSPL